MAGVRMCPEFSPAYDSAQGLAFAKSRKEYCVPVEILSYTLAQDSFEGATVRNCHDALTLPGLMAQPPCLGMRQESASSGQVFETETLRLNSLGPADVDSLSAGSSTYGLDRSPYLPLLSSTHAPATGSFQEEDDANPLSLKTQYSVLLSGSSA